MYLIIGKNGYVASKYIKRFEKTGVPYHAISRSECDYTIPGELEAFIVKNQHNPHYNFWKLTTVFNCAGYIGKPNVDACEANPAGTILGNGVLPGEIAAMCKRLKYKFVHISSGCIFTGYDKEFTENDRPNFSFGVGSIYSASKAMGEERIAKINKNTYIFRLRIPFDSENSPRNYITKMLSYDKLLDAENSMSNLDDFVTCTLHLLATEAPYGIYNVTNPGSITTREVTELINKYIDSDKQFEFYDSEDVFNKAVRAPRSNCVLSTNKLKHYMSTCTSCNATRSVKEAMEDAIKNYK